MATRINWRLGFLKIGFGVIVLGWLCGIARPGAAPRPIDVSLVQLIANPDAFHGKFVRVIGFVKLEFEGDAVYLHQDDYEFAISKNGLWLDVPDTVRRRKAELDKRYVLLEGTFNSKDQGHMDSWTGSIENLTRVQVWREKKDRGLGVRPAGS